MGCMGFGVPKNGRHSRTLGEEHSREIIRRDLDLGVNFFDTAGGYQSGTSEQYLGRTLHHAKREDAMGVMAQNTPAALKERYVWSTGNQNPLAYRISAKHFEKVDVQSQNVSRTADWGKRAGSENM